MELYDGSPESFNEFLDLVLSRGSQDDELIRNAFKYAFDVEDQEKFIHFYLDNPDSLPNSNMNRIQ